MSDWLELRAMIKPPEGATHLGSMEIDKAILRAMGAGSSIHGLQIVRYRPPASNRKRPALLIALGALIAAAGASYGLALMGEPQSVWLWCETLDICHEE